MEERSRFFSLIPSLDPVSPAPLYLQLQDQIRSAIETGAFPPRLTLPAEREISERMGISRVTVRKAISGLVADGMLVRQQGSGTFVMARFDKQAGKLLSFTEAMTAKGHLVTSKWLGREKASASAEEALALGLGEGAAVYRFHRVRYADAAPLAIEVTAITETALPHESAVGASIYEALAQQGQRPVRVMHKLRAMLFEPAQAELLGVEAGSPALYIERQGHSRSGQIIEFTKGWYRGDAYDFVSESG